MQTGRLRQKNVLIWISVRFQIKRKATSLYVVCYINERFHKHEKIMITSVSDQNQKLLQEHTKNISEIHFD